MASDGSRANGRPERVADGTKFVSPQGTRAIKGGIKTNALNAVPDVGHKPPWLRVKLPSGAQYEYVRSIVRSHHLSTVCTRACKFCSVSTGNPNGWLDPLEPMQVADAVRLMNLQYVVLTSVDRDDLADGGAAHYAACITAIHDMVPSAAVEALTPDFAGNLDAVAKVLDAGLVTYAQNLETVE